MGTHFGDIYGNNTLWGHVWEQYTLGTCMGTLHFGKKKKKKKLNLGLFGGIKGILGNYFVGLAYQGKDIVFKFIIEYSSLRDFCLY